MELEAAFICRGGAPEFGGYDGVGVWAGAWRCPSPISPRAVQTRTIQTTGSYNGHQCYPIRIHLNICTLKRER